MTHLEILRMARDQAYDQFMKYSFKYEDSNYTDVYFEEMRNAYMEKFEELIELIEKEQNSPMSL